LGGVGAKVEGTGPRAEGRGQRAEGRGQRAEGRGQRAEGRAPERDAHDKEIALADTLASLRSVVVAYSGGVDSAYLAYVASQTLGDRAVAITADSPSYPERHRQLALRIAREFALHHEIIQTHELDVPEYRANPANRCYYCKRELYSHLSRISIWVNKSRRSTS
jgi:predicted PP-loop superfamily ATPase